MEEHKEEYKATFLALRERIDRLVSYADDHADLPLGEYILVEEPEFSRTYAVWEEISKWRNVNKFALARLLSIDMRLSQSVWDLIHCVSEAEKLLAALDNQLTELLREKTGRVR